MKSPRYSPSSQLSLIPSDSEPIKPEAQPSSLVLSYSSAAQAQATTRSYDADIRHFVSQGGAIPATPRMIAEYIAAIAGVLAVATLQHRLIAIHRAHNDLGLVSPVNDQLVKRTMQGIRRTLGTRQRRVTALVKEPLIQILVNVEKLPPMRAARDKALLLVGFAGAFRRSELVALECADVTAYENGMELLIRRSKTDQEAAGRTVYIPRAHGNCCPVNALRSWLCLAEITTGPLFRQVNRYDQLVGDSGLSAQSVALVVKAAVRANFGTEEAKMFSGHSLRAGYCTEAAEAGLQLHQIREQTGHRSDSTLARYIRPVAKRKIPSLL